MHAGSINNSLDNAIMAQILADQQAQQILDAQLAQSAQNNQNHFSGSTGDFGSSVAK